MFAKKVTYWECAECSRAWKEPDAANRCCHCAECGRVERGISWRCLSCTGKSVRAALQKALEEAPLETGPHSVYYDDASGRFLFGADDVQEFIVRCAEEGREAPLRLWVAREEVMTLTAEEIIAQGLTDHHDEAESEVSQEKVDELQKALDAWCEGCPISSWYKGDTAVTTKVALGDTEEPG